MKKLFSLLLVVSLCFTNAMGQLLQYEPFSYTPDATLGLWTQSGQAWLRINSGDSVLVTNGSLSYTGLASSNGNKIAFDGSGSDYYTVITSTAVTSGSVYMSFVLNVSSLGTLGTTGGYFISLVQGASTTSYGGAVWTRASATPGKYNVGVSTRSNSAVTWLATDLTPGENNFIVIAYDIVSGTANDVARIWLNTSSIGNTEPAPDATSVPGTDLSAAGIDKVLIRQDNAANTPLIEVDEIRTGTTWASVTPSGIAAPSLTIANSLPAFGNVCINTTAGPNSFDISGSNLTTADVTVDALAGFTYSTTAGGTYSSSLTLTQPGGTFAQTVYVKFDPTAVQSYNGNIVISGGGVSASVNVAAAGAGINDAPAVTSGSASAITQNTATVAGTITTTGCTAITSYGIEYSTTASFPNGTGTAVPASNLASGDFSSDLSGLATGTTYYYHAYATNGAGTSYGTELSFTTATPDPQIQASALTAFGNVCINTTAGPNSFSISGSNLTAADITVSSLAGFSFSTTSGGTYTSSLTLTQAGGNYAQDIYVQFTPVAVQSYDGDIVINGGGIAAAVNVAASGSGVNTQASLTTGTASSITFNSAVTAGTVTGSGCSAVTAYGIEYSTTNNFTPGTGTQVTSSNISGGAFTASLSGLAATTVYYFRAWATNGGGTAYGAQQSFTTAAVPISITATALTAFGPACINTTAGPNSFTINGAYLTTADITVGPLSGYTFSTTSGGTYSSSLTLTQPGGTYSQTVYVMFSPVAVQSYNGNIPVRGGGFATTVNVAASGSGVNTVATVVSSATSNISTQSATAAGQVITNGCSAVTAYGIEYSGINGFTAGTGTKVASSNISSGNFSADMTGLVQGATYYYRAYAVNSGGIAYGDQQSFTVLSIGNGYNLYPNPIERGTSVRVTVKDIKPGYYGLILMNTQGEKVYQWNMNIQADFINQTLQVPATLARGVYRAYLVNYEKELGVITVLVL